MKISVWGSALVSWVVASSFAKSGYQVDFVPFLNGSIDTIPVDVENEPNLVPNVEEGVSSGFLRFSSAEQAETNQINILCFASTEDDDLMQVVNGLAFKHKKDLTIISYSGSEIGATNRILEIAGSHHERKVLYIADLLPYGAAVHEFNNSKNMVVGLANENEIYRLQELFYPVINTDVTWYPMSYKEAECVKLSISGMLALRINYINEVANLADKLGLSIDNIKKGMLSDKRVGGYYLNPGCGFGGEKFTKHISSMSEILCEHDSQSLMRYVLSENERQKEMPFRKLWVYYGCKLDNKIISIWGLSYKPGTSSVSNSPSLKVVAALCAQGCVVNVHDPMATREFEKKYDGPGPVNFKSTALEAIDGSDGLIVLTEWSEYMVDYTTEIKKRMRTTLVIDGRNCMDYKKIKEAGIEYIGLGR